jgi:hypothetical protein
MDSKRFDPITPIIVLAAENNYPPFERAKNCRAPSFRSATKSAKGHFVGDGCSEKALWRLPMIDYDFKWKLRSSCCASV